jgi:RHS repeat-associated protein
MEVTRKYQTSLKEEKYVIHISDDENKVALHTYWTKHDEYGTEGKNRYQLPNHLDSVSLELNDNAEIITYEEYLPFGGTALIAGKTVREVTEKEYRYSGKERDSSTGLYYYGARYYAPWLLRWINPDPAGTVDGLNLYGFVRGNVVNSVDVGGMGTEFSRPSLPTAIFNKKTEEFLENPIGFSRLYPISTVFADSEWWKTGEQKFTLKQEKEGNFLSTSNSQILSSKIKAIWLNTGDTYELDYNNEEAPNFIFTSELNSCHLNVKLDSQQKKITVHHSRQELKGDNRDNYTDFLGPEHYDFSQTSSSFTNVTAFIYRNPENNEWSFVYQKIDYGSQYPNPSKLEYIEEVKLTRFGTLPINGSFTPSQTQEIIAGQSKTDTSPAQKHQRKPSKG